jgi:DNA adenine methylase
MTLSPRLRPPFPYFGGKQQVASWIVDLLPEHRGYVEPFAGSLAVLLAKPAAPFETVNDLDGDLVTFWRVLRDQPDRLERACMLTPHARAEHAAAGERPDGVGDVEVARRVWVRLTQGRAGGLTQTGWRFNSKPLRHGSVASSLAGYLGRFAPVAERLAGVSLECRPALEVIADYGRHGDCLLYVDPPYLGTVRGTAQGYAHDMRRAEDHEALAGVLAACQAAVVLSGYRSDLYDRLYSGWWRAELPASTSQGTGVGGGRGSGRVEVLWSNRPLVAQPGFDLPELVAAGGDEHA